MKLVLEVSGDEGVLTTGLDYFVRQNGWDENSLDTKLKFAENLLKKYMRDNVKAYAVKMAMVNAAAQAEAAIGSSLDTTTTVLSEE